MRMDKQLLSFIFDYRERTFQKRKKNPQNFLKASSDSILKTKQATSFRPQVFPTNKMRYFHTLTYSYKVIKQKNQVYSMHFCQFAYTDDRHGPPLPYLLNQPSGLWKAG